MAEDSGLEFTAEVAEVWRAVRALPRRQHEVTVLYYQGDLSINEIADLLQIAPGSVKTHLRYARQRLVAMLGEDDQGGTR